MDGHRARRARAPGGAAVRDEGPGEEEHGARDRERRGAARQHARDLQEVLPVSVLEQYLNPYRFPSFESVAVTGKGVIECLRVGINSTLRRLERI